MLHRSVPVCLQTPRSCMLSGLALLMKMLRMLPLLLLLLNLIPTGRNRGAESRQKIFKLNEVMESGQDFHSKWFIY